MTIDTNRGTITIDLDAKGAPCTVASFAYLGQRHYFDDTPCHRLTTSGIFILQCGDPTGTGTGTPGYSFDDENLDSITGNSYPKGTVAMANAGPDTNGSQFFIVYQDSPLPPAYTPFGSVASGLDIVRDVAQGGDDGAYGSAGGGHPNIPLTITTLTVR